MSAMSESNGLSNSRTLVCPVLLDKGNWNEFHREFREIALIFGNPGKCVRSGGPAPVYNLTIPPRLTVLTADADGDLVVPVLEDFDAYRARLEVWKLESEDPKRSKRQDEADTPKLIASMLTSCTPSFKLALRNKPRYEDLVNEDNYVELYNLMKETSINIGPGSAALAIQRMSKLTDTSRKICQI
jgi:hypothetical protein